MYHMMVDVSKIPNQKLCTFDWLCSIKSKTKFLFAFRAMKKWYLITIWLTVNFIVCLNMGKQQHAIDFNASVQRSEYGLSGKKERTKKRERKGDLLTFIFRLNMTSLSRTSKVQCHWMLWHILYGSNSNWNQTDELMADGEQPLWQNEEK